MALDSHLSKRRLQSHDTRLWLVSAILIAAGTFALDLTGVLEPFDDLAADWATRLLVHRSHVPAEVLLIYADPQPSDQESEKLLTLVARLEELGARHIAFAMPLPEEVDTYCEGRQNLTIGDIVERNRFDPEVLRTSPRSSNDITKRVDAVVALPTGRRGVYREQLASVVVDGNRCTTLESAVARSLRASSAGSIYRVRFRGGAGSLPHLTLEEAIGGNLVLELVTGRTVLIGRGAGPITSDSPLPQRKNSVRCRCSSFTDMP